MGVNDVYLVNAGSIESISGLTDALDARQLVSEKDQPGGYPGINEEGDVVGTFIPRIGTAAELEDIVPADGELVFETDTGFIKVGDGETTCEFLAPHPTRTPPDTANAFVRHLLFQFSETDGGQAATADLDIPLTPYGKPAGKNIACISIEATVIGISGDQSIGRTRRRLELMDLGSLPAIEWTLVNNVAIDANVTAAGTITFSLVNPTTAPALHVHLIAGSSDTSNWAVYLVLTHVNI